MATRAIVPNADGEGSIGRPLLRWGDIQTNKINNLEFPINIEPGSAMKALVVNDDNTGFIIGNVAAGGSGGGGFLVLDNELDLTPLPIGSEYVQPVLEDIQEGDNGRIIVINEEEDAFVILRQPVPLVTIEEGDAGKVLAVKADETGYEHKEIPIASSESLGLIKIGTGISIDIDGTISTPTASTDTSGIVKIGTGISIDIDGVISMPTASTEVAGIVKVGRNLSIDESGFLHSQTGPIINTLPAVVINYSKVILRGEVISFGSIPGNQLEVAFGWKKTADEEWTITTLTAKNDLSTYTEELTILESSTEYEFYFFGLNRLDDSMISTSHIITFTTTNDPNLYIIGVQDDGTRGLDGAGLNQVVGNYPSLEQTTFDTTYFNTHPLYQFADWTDASENVFCEIPIAYWWRGIMPDTIDGTPRWTMLLSTSPLTKNINGVNCTFTASDATFKRNSGYLDSFYIGKYRGYNAGDNKVGSKAGQTPWGNVTFDNFRTYCSNNGTGYHMLSLFEWHEILARMTIEKKTFQLMPEATRAVQSSCVYRGINDFAYGPTLGVYTEWMDGVRTNASGNYELWNTAGGSYVTTSIPCVNHSGSEETYYCQSIYNNIDNLFLSSAAGPNSTSFIPDLAGMRASDRFSRVCNVSFFASNVYHGAFHSHFNSASSEAISRIGCRVAKW